MRISSLFETSDLEEKIHTNTDSTMNQHLIFVASLPDQSRVQVECRTYDRASGRSQRHEYRRAFINAAGSTAPCAVNDYSITLVLHVVLMSILCSLSLPQVTGASFRSAFDSLTRDSGPAI